MRMHSVKVFIIGLFVGILLSGIAWAAMGATLVNGSGNEIGVTGSPIYVQGV